MSELELQEDEREVLLSIYDGDPAFHQLSPITYQYKYGEDGDQKSFLLEISWGKNYPTEKPAVSMNAFYNKHLNDAVKEQVSTLVLQEAEQYIGEAMTYTLFEFVKEKYADLVADLPDHPVVEHNTESVVQDHDQEDPGLKKTVKKEQLSKAQKRKQWDRVDAKGDRPRGWDWVDVVKHLSQTGPKDPPTLTSNTVPS